MTLALTFPASTQDPMLRNARSSKPFRILIVEDELVMAENLARYLTKLGYGVLDMVNSGAEAIAASQRYVPDLILMDITLQGEVDGIAAAGAIIRQWQIPIIYMTDHVDNATLQRAKRTGPYGCLVKPFNLSSLKATIEITLEKHQLDVDRQMMQTRQLVAAQQQIDDLKHRDPLTNLLSSMGLKRHFRRLVTDYVAIAERKANPMIPLLCLRIDGVQRLRSYGLSLSQYMIQQVARRIAHVLGADGVVARMDTYEFAILLNPITTKVKVGQIADHLLAEIARPMSYGHQEIFVTATIGGSLYPYHGFLFSELLTYAQSPVNRLQAKGRNQYQLYSGVLDQSPSMRQLSIESGLHHALERQELHLVYQPKINFRTGAVIGVEALLRWQHPTLGNIPPIKFIPLAESTGLIQPIGEWVIASACRQLRQWHHQGLEQLRMAVNLSILQLKDASLRYHISRCLLENQLPPHALELELTESLLVEDTTETHRCIHALKTVGVDIAVDDFGTGYSSLKYLQQIPIDNIKLDRTFIQDIHHPKNKNAEIVRAIISIARALGARVTAEGVASEGEHDFLRQTGVDVAQGYLISHPLPAETFIQWLKARP
ncbi:MAG: EAL domain-containing protein [Cyanobacteria bacterium J06638_20]